MELFKPLTVEQIQDLWDYFYSTPYKDIPKTKFFWYWRWKMASWLQVDAIEEEFEKEQKLKQARYRQSKIQEITEVWTEYRDRTWTDPRFYTVNERTRTDWRQINIWLPASTLWKDYEWIITIEERENPDFFMECKTRYPKEYKVQKEEYKPF